MGLASYLKQFQNVCWYPSAGRDFLSMFCLSPRYLMERGIPRNETPDCFLFTDFTSPDREAPFLFDHLGGDDLFLADPARGYSVRAFNIRELSRIRIGFDPEMVVEEPAPNYGRVFVADLLMNHPRVGEYIAKLVYVVAENTKFAFDFLLPHHIKIKYVVHSCYGEGFGLGRSTGLFVCHLFEELKTKYFVLDNPNSNREDVAIRFLSPAQLSSVPTLLHILDFRDAFDWNGHYQNALYEVVGYDYFRGGWFHSWFRIADE